MICVLKRSSFSLESVIGIQGAENKRADLLEVGLHDYS